MRVIVRLFVLLALLVYVEAAQAQLTTAIAPGRIEKLVKAGSKAADVVTLTNEGDLPIQVSLSMVDFDVTEAGEVLELPPGMHPSSITPYFRISPLETMVAPGERALFRFEVATPEEFTQLRAFLYFESVPQPPDSMQKQVVFATAMGIPVYAENRKAERGALEVHDIQWQRTGESQEYLQLQATVTNVGERNIRPDGLLSVLAEGGAYSEMFTVNPTADVVLPGHRRVLTWQFGPVPPEALALELRLETSMRESYKGNYRIPKAEVAPASGS